MATIHKLTKDGSTIFPATITDAVVHPNTGKTLTSMIKDYNVSELFPTEGVDGGNKYNLALAIQVLGVHLTAEEKSGGIKLTFISTVSGNPSEEYYLNSSSWSAEVSDWGQRFEVGGVIADPSGSWEPSSAQEYIDEQVGEMTTELTSEIVARQTGDSNLQTQIDSVVERVDDAAFIGNRVGSETLNPNFDPETDTVWNKPQVLSVAQKTQVKQNLGIDTELQLLHNQYTALTQSDVIVGPLPEAGSGQTNTIYRVPGTNSYSDYMYATQGGTETLMATYNNGVDTVPTPNSTNIIESNAVAIHGNALDISELNKSESTLATYTSLSEALATVPAAYQKGGMSIKFILQIYSVTKGISSIEPSSGNLIILDPNIESGTYTADKLSVFNTLPTDSATPIVYYLSDEQATPTYTIWTLSKVTLSNCEYVQYRLMKSAWSTVTIDWQGVDSEPIADSKNLIESGEVYPLKSVVDYVDSVNLFDKSKRIDKRYVRKDTGELTSTNASAYFTTDYITIDSAGCYANYGLTGGSYLGFACYDSDKVYTHGTSNKQATYRNETQNPSGKADAYVRFSGLLTDLDKFMVVKGTSADCPPVSEYVPYGKLGKLKNGIVNTENIKDGTIVDNLTTDDSSKILSAAQGKVIADATMKIVISDNLLDPSAILLGKIANRVDGVIITDSTNIAYGCTPLIPFTEDLICNSVCPKVGTYVGGVVGYNENGGYEGYSYASSAGASLAISKSSHPTWVSVRFNLYPNTRNQYGVYKGTTLPAEFIPYVEPYYKQKDVPDNSIGEEKIKNDAVSFEKISFKVIEIGRNKLNPSTVKNKHYINRTNGVEVYYNDSNLGSTDFIPVSKNGLYCNYGYYGGAAIGSVVYNANKEYIRSIGTNAKLYVYQEGDAYVRFSLNNYDLTKAYVIEGTNPGEYTPYTERTIIDPNVLPTSTISDEEFILKANNNKIFADAIDIILPDKIYAVVGDTLQLFFQGMSKSVNVENYNTLVACSKGSQFHRYFQYTPSASDVGTVNFNFYIKDNNRNILGQGSSSLVTVNAPVSPSSNVNVLCVGDSITAGGQWPKEFMRRLTDNDGSPIGNGLTNITFVGSMLKSGVHYEGNSGYAWRDYATRGCAAFRFAISEGTNVTNGDVYSNNGFQYTVIEVSDNNTIRCSTSSFSNVPTASGILTKVSGSGDSTISFTSSSEDSKNPFWDADNQKLSFTKYANQYCNGSIDVIYVLLGGNALFTDQMGYVKDFIDAFHADFPNSKVKLMGLYVPSMKLMTPGYGASGSLYADTYNVKCKFKDQARDYQEFANGNDYSSFVEYVDTACQLDSDYNFPVTQKAVNTRNNSVTESYANNTLHASPTGGYMQIADAAYRNFVANFCQQ